MQFVNSLGNFQRQGEIRELITRIMFSGHYAEGPLTKQAEDCLEVHLWRPARLFNSCGSALFALYCYYADRGHKKVLMQNNTFYATGAMALEAGLIPVLVDSREDCPSMSVESLEGARATEGGRGCQLVMLTHVGGWLAKDYVEIARYCADHDLILLEDCAHAYGVHGAGHLGAVACWSFYPTKAVPVGDAGALTSTNVSLLRYVERFRTYGKHQEPGLMMYDRGFNLRISEYNAAVLIVQLKYLEDILAARQRDAKKLQLIAKCLLSGESNFYKYPVAREQESGLSLSGLFQTGQVYGLTDQLVSCLASRVQRPVPLQNSLEWATSHVCLPVGEDLYKDCHTADDMMNLLRKEPDESKTV